MDEDTLTSTFGKDHDIKMEGLSPKLRAAIDSWANTWKAVAVAAEVSEGREVGPRSPASSGITLWIYGEGDDQVNLSLGENGVCELVSREGQDSLIADVLFFCDAARTGGMTEQLVLKHDEVVSSRIVARYAGAVREVHTASLHLPFNTRRKSVVYGPY